MESESGLKKRETLLGRESFELDLLNPRELDARSGGQEPPDCGGERSDVLQEGGDVILELL